MFWEYFITSLDTFSPLVTLGFGIYGAVVDTKPKDGKLTRNGKIALIGMIASGAITLCIKGGSLYQKIESQKRELVQRSRQDSIKRHDDSVWLTFQNDVANKLTSVIDINLYF